MSKCPAFQSFELVVAQDEFILLNEENIIVRESSTFLDYKFDHETETCYSIVNVSLLYPCRAYNNTQSRELVIPLRETAPIRGELETAAYGRDLVVGRKTMQLTM
ncbi:hypothetical protein N7461_001915 [Penicillium sp. DV-2018c]|nr:hypothetical protein N7461_001915 [Penicillium sp. DV-2018c]